MRRPSSLFRASAGVAALAILAVSPAASAAVGTGQRGPSTTVSPYVLPVAEGAEITSLLTVGDLPAGNGYKMVGIPDGLGARDAGNGKLELFMNHELTATAGAVRAHGQKGSFVSDWVIDAATLAVDSGQDLIGAGDVSFWDYPSGTFGPNPSTASPPFLAQSAAFARFCSSTLTDPGQLLNPISGNGFSGQIYFGNEENGDEARVFGILGDGTTKQLPRLGLSSWENTIPAHNLSDTTLVQGQEDGASGQIWSYVGTKTNAGDAFDRAGLSNGTHYVADLLDESVDSDTEFRDTYGKGVPVQFDLADVDWHQTGAAQNTEGATDGLSLNRIEDGHWDPSNPRDYYFVTTEGGATNKAPGTTNSRDGGGLWRLRYKDIDQPTKGGTLTLLLDGSETPYLNKPDNMAIDTHGNILIQEDPGGNASVARIVAYDIGSGRRGVVAAFDPALFAPATPGGTDAVFTADEESSGIIDAASTLGDGQFLFDAQVHKAYPSDTSLVEYGQLLHLAVTDWEAVYTGRASGGSGPPGRDGADGQDGQDGQNGSNGTNGQNGTNGTNGTNGQNGTNGAAGPAGSAGPAGPAGPAGEKGDTGPAGRDGKVTCKLNRTRTRVTCNVVFESRARARARLKRSGRTVARGRVVGGRVTLVSKRRLTRGAYTLVAGAKTMRIKLR